MFKLYRVEDPDEINYVRNKRDGFCLWGLFKKDRCSSGLDVRHITTKGSESDDDQKNLISLCRKHHIQAHAGEIAEEQLRGILARMFNYVY